MFDIGFSELVLIALLALIVLGPKRLPEVARAAGHWAGRIRRFVDSVKRDMESDMQDEGLAAIRDAHRSIKQVQAELSQTASDAVYDIIEAPARDGNPAPARDSDPLPARDTNTPAHDADPAPSRDAEAPPRDVNEPPPRDAGIAPPHEEPRIAGAAHDPHEQAPKV
jgi:sec-independent protein translocase protein TatB